MVVDGGDGIWKETTVVHLFCFEHHKSNFLYFVDKAALSTVHRISLVTGCLNGLWMGTPHNELRFTEDVFLLLDAFNLWKENDSHIVTLLWFLFLYKRFPVRPVAALVANISTLALQKASERNVPAAELSSAWQLRHPHYDIYELSSLLCGRQLHNVSFEANVPCIVHLNKHNVEVFYCRVNWWRFICLLSFQ